MAEVRERYGISAARYAVVLFHPVTTEIEQIPEQVAQLRASLMQTDDHYIVVYPNNDMGSHLILDAWKGLRGHPRFQVFPSIQFERFLVLLRNADYIIGNSSAGIREAPFFGTPAIGIGTRQNRRSDSAGILHCDYPTASIFAAIEQVRCWPREGVKPSHRFGKGDSVSRFAQALAAPGLWSTSLQKQFHDR